LEVIDMSVIKLIIPENPLPMELPTLDVSDIKRKYLDVPYSSQSKLNTLDIYLPDEGDGPFPTVVFFHGGAFTGGDKRDFQVAIVLDALERGFAVVSANYRLSPDTLYPYPLFDVKAAIRHLRANAGKYKLDADTFISAGTSAGAYYAVMSAATQEIPQFEDFTTGDADADSHVKATIGFFGVYNLITQSEFTIEQGVAPGMPGLFNFADIFVGLHAPDHPELMYFSNPVNFVTDKMPRILIQGGECDEVVPYVSSVELYEKVKAVCGEGRVQFDSMSGALHGDPMYNEPENQERIFKFLREQAGI
jgi:acetyl esterase/lipase